MPRSTKLPVVKILALLGVVGLITFAVTLSSQAEIPANPTSISPLDKAVEVERDKAVEMARNGQHDIALTSLSRLHERYPAHDGITRDYAAVLGWAGHDEEAVKLYETLPAEQPDYVLAAVAKSYRNLNQPEKALAAYQTGAQKYPDSVLFVEGQLRSLYDLGRYEEALIIADEDLKTHGLRNEIVTAKADIVQAQIRAVHDKAVMLGRDKQYKESLALFRGDLLNAETTTDVSLRQDYLAVLGWAGGNDKKVIEIYNTLPEGERPDYVLAAVAKAYRNLKQPQKAAEIYSEGASKYPDSKIFAIGAIRVNIDSGRYDTAKKQIDAYIQAHGRDAEVDNAKTMIARRAGQSRFDAARKKAVTLARQGKHQQALDMLNKLDGKKTKNVGIIRDRIAITGWMGGHDTEVVQQYESLRSPSQPDYVLAAVGQAYRNLGQHEEAAKVYATALRRYPKNEAFAVGTIRSLTDAGYIEKALQVAENDITAHGNRFEVVLAAADAAGMYNQNDALTYYQTAANLQPHNTDVLRGLIRTSVRLGAPQVALQVIEQNPGIVSDGERRMIEGDEAAAQVRLAAAMDNDDERASATDSALSNLDRRITQWQGEGSDAQPAINRARFDRIIALHDRSRMKDVIAEYNTLSAEGVALPAYNLGAVGDAYLDQHQPEKARDLYLKALELEPKNRLLRRQLFYSYVDTGDWKSAYSTANAMVRDGTVWDRRTNEDVPMTDEQHQSAELTAGAARLYFGQVTEADKRILPAVARNPNTPQAHEAMGNLANAHNHPREALAHYEAGVQAAGGATISNEVGVADTQLRLKRYPEAEASVKSLVKRFPNNASVMRSTRAWDVHNMAELQVRAGYAFDPITSSNVTGGRSFGLEGKIYTSPIRYNWRLFAGEYFTHQKEPNGEGSIGYSRTTAGVEYRKDGLTVNLAPTYNAYDYKGRVGVEADATYAIDDNWTVAGGGEIFSRETPLRALNQGVTADSFGAHATWSEDEARDVRFGGSLMSFSDGNTRTAEDVDYRQTLLTYPDWRLDSLASLGASQNSADTNRSYYNPGSDFIGLAGARAVHYLYQRYSTLWQHSLTFTPGFYWQQDYGTDLALRARYEHRVFFNETFNAGLGVNYARQSYDGRAEDNFSLGFDLTNRF